MPIIEIPLLDVCSRGIRCRPMCWNDLADECAEAAARAQFLESIGELDPSFWIEFRSDSWRALMRSRIAYERARKTQEQNRSRDLGLLAKEQEQEQDAEQQRDNPSSFDPMDPICCICRYDAHFDPKEFLLAAPVSVVDVLESPAKKPRLAILS